MSFSKVVLPSSIPSKEIQSSLDFATMGLATNLDLATSRALTDFRQYINNDLKFWPLCSEMATVEVILRSGLEQKLLLATDHLVAISSEKPLNLSTSIGFSYPDHCDDGWSQNPM